MTYPRRECTPEPLSALVFLQSIMKIPDIVDHLKGLSDQGMALGPLLALLLPPLGNCIFDKKLYVETALQLVKRLPLGEQRLSFFCVACIQHGSWFLAQSIFPQSAPNKRPL